MIAWAALGIWPLVSFICFLRLTVPAAVAVTIIGGYLLLPMRVGLDLPMLPALNKETIPVLVALALALMSLQGRDSTAHALKGLVPRNIFVLGLLGVLVAGVVGSVRTNQDDLVFGPRVLQAIAPYDGLSILLEIAMLLSAYILGRKFFASKEAQRRLLIVIVVSALLYTLPALWEMRMSPQLHAQVYGFAPSAFIQQMRASGFRPMVFTGHGLSLSFFLASGVLAAATLFRSEPDKDRMLWGTAMGWLFIILVLCKSLGALIIVLVLLPAVLFFRPRLQLLGAACIALSVLTYPFLRSNDLVPVDGILGFIERIDERRAESLLVRLSNEEVLMARALERPLFGWGTWGRPRIYDAKTGADLSVTDGAWVIHLGIGGWFRYVGLFGLLCYPVLALALYRRQNADPVAIGLVLILCAKLVDLLPNSEIGIVYWMIAGALLGRVEMKAADMDTEAGTVPQTVAAQPAGPGGPTRSRTDGARYARDFTPNLPPEDAGSVPDKTRKQALYTRPKPASGYRR